MVFITSLVHFWIHGSGAFIIWDILTYWTGVLIQCVCIFGSGSILIGSAWIFQVGTFISGFLDLDTSSFYLLLHLKFKRVHYQLNFPYSKFTFT